MYVVCVSKLGGIAKEIVDTIMEILADVDAISMPCTSRRCRFSRLEKQSISADSVIYPLKYDGTTQKGKSIMEVELEMESGAYVLALRIFPRTYA